MEPAVQADHDSAAESTLPPGPELWPDGVGGAESGTAAEGRAPVSGPRGVVGSLAKGDRATLTAKRCSSVGVLAPFAAVGGSAIQLPPAPPSPTDEALPSIPQ
jgi:hypothetical protein